MSVSTLLFCCFFVRIFVFVLHSPQQGSFQLMVRLDDNDFNSPDLIDRVVPNVTLAVSTSFSSVRSQLGFYRIATLQLSFRVMCSQNFYGSDCTVFCQPQSSDALGHFTCNSAGERICSNEYTGADCRTRMFVCLFVFPG